MFERFGARVFFDKVAGCYTATLLRLRLLHRVFRNIFLVFEKFEPYCSENTLKV